MWRSEAGEDGSIVTANRIVRIRADGGGTGENGNGVNVFRAGSVLVSGNRITDCAYSAVRGNAASDIQIVANSCARLGEVAIYAEFGFEGALIANNLVDTAATGITVTNFNEGGRLAVVQGNLVRNLFRREHEPVDKRGHGITVEADTVLTGNVVEGAPTAGIVIGWGQYMREVVATSNLVRASRVGILVTADKGAGACLLSNNMVSGATDGAIRAMDAQGNPTGPELAHGGSNDKLLSIAGNASRHEPGPASSTLARILASRADPRNGGRRGADAATTATSSTPTPGLDRADRHQPARRRIETLDQRHRRAGSRALGAVLRS